MFVYSVRASTLKFFAFVALTVALLVAAVTYGASDNVYAISGVGDISYENIKTNEDRIAFIEKFGVAVKDSASEEQTFTMPDNFDRVISGYNEIQKRQGLSLDKYSGKKVTRYTYEVENYKDYDGAVFVNLFVYRNRIIACDICGAAPESFITPLTLVDPNNLISIDEKGE